MNNKSEHTKTAPSTQFHTKDNDIAIEIDRFLQQERNNFSDSKTTYDRINNNQAERSKITSRE
jgi:hypothetical protein